MPFRRSTIEFWLLSALVILIIGLLATLIKLRKSDYSSLSNVMAKKSREQLQLLKPCPICSTMLGPGERVKTTVFSGDGKSAYNPDRGSFSSRRIEDAMVHMYGCPYCYPANRNHPRICPVCRNELPETGYVIARMFMRKDRKHVHVLGCTECRSNSVGRQFRSAQR
ncbi:MAG: hypothetical protein ACOC45_06460 [Alkalispirochaetaceae bacterium]